MSLLPHFVLLLLLVAAFATIPSLADGGHDDHKPPHHDDGHDDHEPPHHDDGHDDHNKPPHSEKPTQEHDHELPKKKPPTEEPPHHGPHAETTLGSHHKPPPKHKGPPHRSGQTQLLEVAEELAGRMPRKVKPSFPVPSKEFSPTEKEKHHGHGHHD